MLREGGTPTEFAWYLGIALAFTAAPFANWKRWKRSSIPWVVAALALPTHYLLLRDSAPLWLFPDDKGLFILSLALPGAAAFAFLFFKNTAPANPARIRQLEWFGGAALFFVTLFFPEQFDRTWLTLGWALEAVVLCALARWARHAGRGGGEHTCPAWAVGRLARHGLASRLDAGAPGTPPKN
jgi:hypothetical protein